jgi:serine/threonine protein kinase
LRNDISFWIILELVQGGDLLQYMAVQSSYSESMAARHFKQVLQGIHYLHSLGIVHRDLKLDNILLSTTRPDADIKIADFGLSALVRLGSESGYDPDDSIKRKGYRGLHETWGTREYFAPELIDQKYGPQADIWALGCVLYEVLCGHQAYPPRRTDNHDTFYSRIRSCDYDFNHSAFLRVSEESKDLVKKLIVVDPLKRLSATEAIFHPWITGEYRVASGKDIQLSESLGHMRFRAEEKERRKKMQKKT